jgi:hypothetical protein
MPGRVLGELRPGAEQTGETFALALTALAFALVGLVLTLWRLRSAGISLWAVAFFFVPIANVLLFAILCAVPPAPVRSPPPAGPRAVRGVIPGRAR